MASPFLSALTGFAQGNSLFGGVMGGINAYNQTEALNTFSNRLRELRQTGVDPRTAFANLVTQDPETFFALPENVRTDANKLIQLMTPTPEEVMAGPDGGVIAIKYDPTTGAASARPVMEGTPSALRLIANYEEKYGPLTPEQKRRIIGAEAAPGTDVRVSVGAPNLGPIAELMADREKSERNTQLTKLALAEKNINDLKKWVNSPEAGQLFGPTGWLAEQTAPIAAALGESTAFGPFGGPDIKTVGELQSSIRTALIGAASLARSTAMKDTDRVLKEDTANIEKLLANPDAFFTSPEQIRGALRSVENVLNYTKMQFGAELRMGGVVLPSGVDRKAVGDTAKWYMENEGLDAATAVEKALQRLSVSPPSKNDNVDLDAGMKTPPKKKKTAPPSPAPAATTPTPKPQTKTTPPPDTPPVKITSIDAMEDVADAVEKNGVAVNITVDIPGMDESEKGTYSINSTNVKKLREWIAESKAQQ